LTVAALRARVAPVLDENLKRIRERIHASAARAGRDSAAITLVGVTKTVAPKVIQQAISFGLADIGENRVQEAEVKRQELDAWLRAQGSGFGVTAPSPQPSTQSVLKLRWHLIGHLQKNKAKRAVELFDVVHSVDSGELIRNLERHAADEAKKLPVFIQVNVSGEAAKFGCKPEGASALADTIRSSGHLQLAGLMTVPPYADNPQANRIHFEQLRLLRDKLGPQLKLSMGMSHDFEAAIEEGADIVRIGTAIFGSRS